MPDFVYSRDPFERLTHYAFRYPAKFHPPVARALVSEYVRPGETVLDPFAGSGTLLVEALAEGRHAVGSDIDPVAAFVSRVKTRRFDPVALLDAARRLFTTLSALRRPEAEYENRKFPAADISAAEFDAVVAAERLWIPNIPSPHHWFRRYVLVDLARIRRTIGRLRVSPETREFFVLAFLSILRASSNADPVPVSGLEVTAHMKARDARGRVVDPFALLERAVEGALGGAAEFAALVPPGARAHVYAADATELTRAVAAPVDAVITSPPYHNAVDYYRRHQLEMYWLGATPTHSDRLAVLPKYIGRHGSQRRHPFVRDHVLVTPAALEWERRIREVSPGRADNFKHYMVAMRKVFGQIATLLRPEGRAVFVVGHSTWNSSRIPTTELLCELAAPLFRCEETFSYEIPNRYMSYSRRNGASIDREYVVAFRRTDTPVGDADHRQG